MIDGVYYGDCYLSIEEAYLLEQYRLLTPEQKKLMDEHMEAIIAERQNDKGSAGADASTDSEP